jgi:hypothetical protein
MHAMAKCDPCDTTTVFRVFTNNPQLHVEYPVGRKVTWYQFNFVSCTAPEFLGPSHGDSRPRTVFCIELTTGRARDITKISLIPTERMILLPPNCRFEVIGLLDAGNNTTFIQLKELPSLDPILDFNPSSAAAAEGVAILSPSISIAAAGCARQASVVRTFASSVYKSLYTQAAAPQSHARLFVALEDFIAAYCHHYGCDASSGIRILVVICVSLCCMLLRAVAHVFLLLHQERLYSIACRWTPCSGRVKWCST